MKIISLLVVVGCANGGLARVSKMVDTRESDQGRKLNPVPERPVQRMRYYSPRFPVRPIHWGDIMLIELIPLQPPLPGEERMLRGESLDDETKD
mmetsp:Transcript_981/g.1572  ORF Transcript_981/g.1572 Transcript_981/m.1572 type:complete len:94 (+) Transcript_981:186-467(+)|eukprot:CAMPEP_0203761014 /NCGR_PEP_ID=MMETSP0098-20131031/14189_1 /ASSEMBLY_ACC=CAM_ASM_000208 /TAXON_ID=96639 /ORGANISM=" , Strain NY0313808BC1" /LENGTH=93 /DNA_ID=CAMNT_0050654817 /DNA_START=1229 /DNA_END=1510 /DNA_ORIENTATION=-